MDMPTKYGDFRLYVWNGPRGQEPVALTTPLLDPDKEVMLRLHSECLTGDAFGSLTCDCGPQKDLALKRLHEHGNGVFLYHRQEGRNMGLYKKIHAYNLMMNGLDTHEANIALTGAPDGREYSDTLDILDTLLKGQKSRLRMLTNNPYKQLFLERYGYRVTPEPLRTETGVHNEAYAAAKIRKFLHSSIGFGPYVSFTLKYDDIGTFDADCGDLLRQFDVHTHGRQIFVGVELPENLLADSACATRLQNFYKSVGEMPGVHLVLHIDHPSSRAAERKLQRFLRGFDFPFSLQVRMKNCITFDPDFIDALYPQYVILQIRSEQISTIINSRNADYLSSPYRFVLLDDSWGKGIAADGATLKRHVLRLIESGVNRIAIAGGLDAESVGLVTELEDYFKLPISADAESRMRTGDRPDAHKIASYIGRFIARKK